VTTAYRVVSLRKRWPKLVPEYFVYVGRAWAGLSVHPLANPYTTGDVIAQYREWLHSLPDLGRLARDLRADTECGRLPLACWCGDGRAGEPLRCHAMVLADAMAGWFPQDTVDADW
jgi:hypothetical protein